MTKPVITASHLGKKYRIGIRDEQSDTIIGSIVSGFTTPFRNLRNIRNLSKLDGGDETISWALKDVSFELLQGEVLGIIGHNGAGKSTLLKILSQITEPSEGEVVIRGRVSALLEVGTGFHPELTGRENVYMNGTILGMTKKEIDRKFDEIVEFSGVNKYIDTPVKFYSSGMKVRLGFGVAAHLEPDVLIIDEVLAVGDVEFQKKCLGKMEDVAKQGRTVLFVSHNLNAIITLCSRSILLDRGQVVLDSSSKEVIDCYLESKVSHPLVYTQYDDFLTSIFLKNDQDISRTEFLFGEEIIFCFSFRNIENRSRIGLAVSDEFERRIFVDLFSIPSAYSGTIIKARIPKNVLTPGKYSLSLSLMSPYERVYWIKQNILFFQISKLSSKYEKLTYDYGVVNLDIRWEC